MRRLPQGEFGFTLMEILLMLFVMGVMAAMTQYHFRPSRAQSIHSLITTLRFARNYAVLHHHAVLVCGGSQKGYCEANWENGLLAIDTKQHKTIASLRWSDRRCHMQYQGAGFKKSRILLNYLGFAAGSQGSFRFTGPRCHTNDKVVVAPCGRVRLARV